MCGVSVEVVIIERRPIGRKFLNRKGGMVKNEQLTNLEEYEQKLNNNINYYCGLLDGLEMFPEDEKQKQYIEVFSQILDRKINEHAKIEESLNKIRKSYENP